jgi:SAM-dependent methyltransferase
MNKLTQRMKIARMSDMHISSNHHHYIVLSLLHSWITDIALPHASGVLLDYGCGGQPYRSLFETRVSQYIGADVEAAIGIKLDLLIKPDEPLALASQSVDTILSTQTLEHVLYFRKYLAECRRLLRPGGQLILTVPMQWRMHEVPFDYWRFTKYGVLAALEEHGLEVFHLSPCGGAWALLGQLLNSHLATTQRGSKALFRLINRTALWMDKRLPDTEETIGWMCIAKAPSLSG